MDQAKRRIKAINKVGIPTLQELPLPVYYLFLMNILDRNNIANAKISGLPTSLGIFANTEYNTCLRIFYIGYVLTQVPSNILILKVKPSLYIGFVTAGWANVSVCQSITNFAGLFMCRFILGLIEGPFLLGVFLLLSCCAFGELVVAGIVSRMENRSHRPTRQWLLIIEGAMTIAIAIFVIPFISDFPLRTKRLWLRRERQLLTDGRLQKEKAGAEGIDPILLPGALSKGRNHNNFFPSIVGTLGYNDTITLLITAPPYFAALVHSLCVSFHAAHKQERGLHIAIPLLFSLLGNLLVRTPPLPISSIFLMTAGSYTPLQPLCLWLSSSLFRPRTKRAAALAIMNSDGENKRMDKEDRNGEASGSAAATVNRRLGEEQVSVV
ncbi:major facilitator superfamily domain-containing protein [Aspergillus desertorum]